MPQNDDRSHAMYKGRKVLRIRPAANGDRGWDPTRQDQTVVRYDDENHEDRVSDTTDFVVNEGELTPV